MVLHSWPYENMTGLTDWYVWANDVSGGSIGVFLLVGIFLISLRVVGGDEKQRMLSSMFITFTFSVLLRAMNILNEVWVIACFTGLVGLMGYYAWNR